MKWWILVIVLALVLEFVGVMGFVRKELLFGMLEDTEIWIATLIGAVIVLVFHMEKFDTRITNLEKEIKKND